MQPYKPRSYPFLNKGLVSKLDPALLQEGQYQLLRNTVSVQEGVIASRHGFLKLNTAGFSGTFINTENLDSVVALIASTLSSGEDMLRDIFEMRHLLEPQIAALAAERATAAEVQRLREILEDQQRQIGRGESGVEADTAFHFALASSTHNAALVKVVSAVEDILQRSRDQSLQEPGRPQRSWTSHGQILQMVEAGDAAGARRAMEHHLTVVEPAMLSLSDQPKDFSLSP